MYMVLPFVSLLVSCVLTVILFLAGPQSSIDSIDPNIELPDQIQEKINQMNAINLVGPIPWTTVSRESVVCKTSNANCSIHGPAYVVTLPAPAQNTWYLSSVLNFRTGWPAVYPCATVVVVGPQIPKEAKYIIDLRVAADPSGIVPMINSDNSVKNMSNTWTNVSGQGHNVTGDFASSFVLINNSDHDVFFSKNSLEPSDITTTNGPLITYWRIKKASRALLWPSTPYWHSINNSIGRSWNASTLNLTNDNACAFIAETMMYNILAPLAPIVS